MVNQGIHLSSNPFAQQRNGKPESRVPLDRRDGFDVATNRLIDFLQGLVNANPLACDTARSGMSPLPPQRMEFDPPNSLASDTEPITAHPLPTIQAVQTDF